MVNSPTYINKVQQFLSSHSAFILKRLIIKDDYHLDEVNSVFMGKCTGYIHVKKDSVKKGNVNSRLESAIKQNNYNYLRSVLNNTIKDYNESLLNENNETDAIISKFEFTELEDLNMNFNFINYIIEREPLHLKDRSLGITLLLLIDALELKPDLIYNILNVNRYTKSRYVYRTRNIIKQIFNEHLPKIDLTEIEEKIQAKQRLLDFILNNHAEVIEQIRLADHLKTEIEKDNYKEIKGELHKLIDELDLEPSRTSSLKRYVKQHYYPRYDQANAFDVISNVHVWQKEFNALAHFIRSFDLMTTNPMNQ